MSIGLNVEAPPIDAYRREIEIDDARLEYELRDILVRMRKFGRPGMCIMLNEALREHGILAVEKVSHD